MIGVLTLKFAWCDKKGEEVMAAVKDEDHSVSMGVVFQCSKMGFPRIYVVLLFVIVVHTA